MRIKSFITLNIALAACIYLAGCSTSRRCENFEKAKQYLLSNFDYADQIHPILGVKAGESLPAQALNNSPYLELEYFKRPCLDEIWKRDFYKAERQAAEHCCNELRGRPRGVIEILMGLPKATVGNDLVQRERLILRHQLVWPTVPATGFWFYEIGGNQIPIKLSIKNNLCVNAEVVSKISDYEALTLMVDSRTMCHPILCLRPDQSINTRTITADDVKKLKSMEPAASLATWERDYGKAERDVADWIERLVKGRTMKGVKELLGEPFYKASKIEGWRETARATQIWIYYFGGVHVPVRLFFSNEKCIKAERFDGDQETLYDQERTKELIRFCNGKSFEEIVRQEGIPSMIESGSKPSSMSADYMITPSSMVTLKFENGICKEAITGRIFH